MTTGIAIILAVVALGGSGLALLAVHAWRGSHDRLARSLLETTSRLAALARQLDDALDRLRKEARITVALGDIAASPDLADVLTRVAAAAAAATGARAAVARAVADDGTLVVGATEEAAGVPVTAALEWPPEGARAMTFTLLRGSGPSTGPHLGCGLAVPIAEPSAAPVGLVVALFDEHESAAESKLGDLERLAARVAPIVTAVRSGRPDGAAARDPLTRLGSRQLFHESLAREVARAHRHRSPLALLLLDIDGFRAVNERLGRRGADASLLTFATALEAVAPPGAVACRIGGDDFALILPGSGRLDVELVLAHLRAEHRDRGSSGDELLSFSTGVAELMPADDALRLFERATRAMQGGRDPGRDRLDDTAGEVDEPA